MADDYGAIFSEEGVPVTTASDDQKVLDTRWVTLDIAEEPNYTATLTLPTTAPGNGSTLGGTYTNVIAYSHNLGFLPAFDYEIVSSTVSDPNAVSVDPVFVSDGQNIYYSAGISTLLSSVTVTINVNFRIYNLPITTNYVAPVVQTDPTAAPVQTGYGAKFLNSNSLALSINNSSVENFSFNTQLRPLNILQHGPVTVPSSPSDPNFGKIIINYSYNGRHPVYLLAIYYPTTAQNGNATLPSPSVGALTFSGGQSTITDTVLTIAGAQSALIGSFAYILLKDPLDIVQ